MFFSKSNNIPKISIIIDGKRVEQVTSYQYIAELVLWDSLCEKGILRSNDIAKRKFSEMTGQNTSHDLTLAKCYAWSIAFYGCETGHKQQHLKEDLEFLRISPPCNRSTSP